VKEATGLTTEKIPFPESSTSISVQELFRILESRHSKLKDKKLLSSVAVAVNLEYVEIADGEIKLGDEVAIIPPVSGG
jgi:molybdopterin synthase sulfur carrier subunit